MLALTDLIHLLKSEDPDVANQAWEICAALSLAQRKSTAETLAGQYRWGWAARCLIPDQPLARERILMHFAIDCTSQALPLLMQRPQLYAFCEDALSQSRSLLVPGRDSTVAQKHLLSRCKRELRFSSRLGPPPVHLRLVLDATLTIIRSRDGAQVARHASALARRALHEGASLDAADGERWQQERFFELLLPLASAIR